MQIREDRGHVGIAIDQPVPRYRGRSEPGYEGREQMLDATSTPLRDQM